MARIQISETQFAFAFFHKYLLLNKDEDVIFLFPTLRQEGNPEFRYAGADLVVDENLIFQFKMAEILKTKNAIEFFNKQIGTIEPPYFRMWIKNSLPSEQFNLLKKAVRKKYNVKYIAPLFDYEATARDDDAFKLFYNSTPSDSMNYICSIDIEQFVIPRNFPLSSDNTHKICYSRRSVVDSNISYLFTEPKGIKIMKGVKEFNNQSLVFSDNPKTFETIERTIQNIIDTFEIGDRIKSNASLEDVQTRLIIEHNIFWLPVLRSKSKRRTRLIRTIEQDD